MITQRDVTQSCLVIKSRQSVDIRWIGKIYCYFRMPNCRYFCWWQTIFLNKCFSWYLYECLIYCWKGYDEGHYKIRIRKFLGSLKFPLYKTISIFTAVMRLIYSKIFLQKILTIKMCQSKVVLNLNYVSVFDSVYGIVFSVWFLLLQSWDSCMLMDK